MRAEDGKQEIYLEWPNDFLLITFYGDHHLVGGTTRFVYNSTLVAMSYSFFNCVKLFEFHHMR